MKKASLLQKVSFALMILSIMIIGFQIGVTAKTESNDYFFLLPIGISLLLAGLFISIKESRKAQS